MKDLNEAIESELSHEIHPDRFNIGHAIWLNVDSTQSFASALSKVVIEFKYIKDIEWSIFHSILQSTALKGFKESSYKELTQNLQKMYFFKTAEKTSIKACIGSIFDNTGNN